MEKSSKFSANFSKLLCDILNDGIAELQLIRVFPIEEIDHTSIDLGVCRRLIDMETFLPCKSVQGALNKEKFQKDSLDLIESLQDIVEELKSVQTFENLLKNVDESSAELLDLHLAMENFRHLKKTALQLEHILEGQNKHDKQKEVEAENELLNQHIVHQNEQLDVKAEKSYNESYVRAQIRQNEVKLNNEENHANNDLLKITKKMCDSQDVHYKICS